MSAINLDKSIETLKKCYVGKDEAGIHQLDKTKVDDLAFRFAYFRVNLALKEGEITEKEFLKKLEEKDNA